MCQSFQIHYDNGNPLGIWIFEDLIVRISVTGAKILFKCLTQVTDLIGQFFFVKGKIGNDDFLLIDQALNPDLVHLFFYVIPLQK